MSSLSITSPTDDIEAADSNSATLPPTASQGTDFEHTLVGKELRARCKQCNSSPSAKKGGPTSHLLRHSKHCPQTLAFAGTKINFSHESSGIANANSSGEKFVSAIHDGKLDMMSMREGVAQMILMHDLPFRFSEYSGFNMLMKRGLPDWKKISQKMAKSDCMKVYETEKKKIKNILGRTKRICLTTDLWRSHAQTIEYMVITGHFVDERWNLQKRVLSFFHLPSPHRGVDLSDAIFKCLKEWEIENKVFTISVDNSSANDVCLRILKETLSRSHSLPFGGALFHHRCCAHILNIMVQHGLSQVNSITTKIHRCVDYLRGSEGRLKLFANIVQQLQLPHRKLILECKTRWNSTHDMLATALKFREVFPRYTERDAGLESFCPSDEDWEKISKVCEFLEVFKGATEVISDSHYPTSNLFLSEVYRVKKKLDEGYTSSDDFIRSLSTAMKERFDKYWGECNLVMALGAILDPRLKLQAVDYIYKQMYPIEEARKHLEKIKTDLKLYFNEYVEAYRSGNGDDNEVGRPSNQNAVVGSKRGLCDILMHMKSISTVVPIKSDLDNYLEEGCYICDDPTVDFDVLGWWKSNRLRYRILSVMASDILSIPITTVASEATFSAGGRVIDPHRASLAPSTVEALLCAGDWCRNLYSVARMSEDVDTDDNQEEIILPIS